jgi:hypothetical protein
MELEEQVARAYQSWTVFHVTMAPQDLVFLKCRRNLGAGYRVYLLVPGMSVKFLHRGAHDGWCLPWLAEGIHLGRGPIDRALCVANGGTMNWTPTGLVRKN